MEIPSLRNVMRSLHRVGLIGYDGRFANHRFTPPKHSRGGCATKHAFGFGLPFRFSYYFVRNDILSGCAGVNCHSRVLNETALPIFREGGFSCMDMGLLS